MSTESLKIGAALVLLGPFLPLLFNGEEWGASTPFQYFVEHEDPALAAAVTEGRQNEFRSFGWDPESVPDPQAESTFTNSKLNWDEIAEPVHADLLQWHKDLIGLRRTEPALRQGRRGFDVSIVDEAIVMTRAHITVVANLGARAVEVDIRPGVVLLHSKMGVTFEARQLKVPAGGVAVARQGYEGSEVRIQVEQKERP